MAFRSAARSDSMDARCTNPSQCLQKETNPCANEGWIFSRAQLYPATRRRSSDARVRPWKLPRCDVFAPDGFLMRSTLLSFSVCLSLRPKQARARRARRTPGPPAAPHRRPRVPTPRAGALRRHVATCRRVRRRPIHRASTPAACPIRRSTAARSSRRVCAPDATWPCAGLRRTRAATTATMDSCGRFHLHRCENRIAPRPR